MYSLQGWSFLLPSIYFIAVDEHDMTLMLDDDAQYKACYASIMHVRSELKPSNGP